MEVNSSARSTRKRTQVGTTNRSSTSSPKVLDRGGDGCRSRGIPPGASASGRPRPSSSVADGLGGDGSFGTVPLASTRSLNQNLGGDKATRTVSMSRSMPSLGLSAERASKGRGSRDENDGSAHSSNGPPSARNAAVRGGIEEGRPRPPADDFYLSSTQMSYMSGLQAPESKVPILDPYLHSELLHERWINRASQRLGELANIKYGSVREFFRLYDANCDGVLDFDEFSKGITMSQLDHLFPRSLQRSLFDRIDSDKSGSIELDEFARFLVRGMAQGAPAEEVSAWQKQERARKMEDPEACSVKLQPINDFKTQRIKNKLSHCLNKAVPNASAGLADNRTMFLKKQFAFLHKDSAKRGMDVKDLARTLGPRGMNLGVSEEDVRCLVTAMDSSGDGTITLKEFASFLNLDDHEPLYQPLFDGRRRNVNIMQATVDSPAPAASPEDAFILERAVQLHAEAVPSKPLDVAVRMERDMRDPPPKGQHAHHAFRPESPPWLVDHRSVSVATPSGRTVVDVWDLPPPTRHLSAVKSSLTSSMRSLSCPTVESKDGADVAFGSDGGPFAVASPQETMPVNKKALSGLSSSQELFSSLEDGRLQVATASALARTRKVAKQTWADVGHGGNGDDAGTDECSSYYAGPSERFTTTSSERFGPLIREKKVEKGQRSAWFYRQRHGDSATGSSQRQQTSEDRSRKIRAHLERISLSVKAEEVAAKLKGERRVRGKARTRLRYSKWINSQDNWLRDEVPKLADFQKRQFPEQNLRLRGGQQVHEAVGGPRAIAV